MLKETPTTFETLASIGFNGHGKKKSSHQNTYLSLSLSLSLLCVLSFLYIYVCVCAGNSSTLAYKGPDNLGKK